MGIKVLETVMDAEIAPLMNKINEYFPFLQTISSCSGWTRDLGNKGGIMMSSDGIHRRWTYNPYFSVKLLDNKQGFKFVSYLMSKLIFSYNFMLENDFINEEDSEIKNDKNNYENMLKNSKLNVDNHDSLIFVSLEYVKNKIIAIFRLNAKNRPPEEIEKLWFLIDELITEYYLKLKEENK